MLHNTVSFPQAWSAEEPDLFLVLSTLALAIVYSIRAAADTPCRRFVRDAMLGPAGARR